MNYAIGRWLKAGALMFIAMLIVAGCEGPAGVAGAKGVQGDPGEQGPKGDSGLGVVSIVPVTEDGTITLTITLTSGDPVVLTIPSGTDGTAGTAGRGIESVTSSGPDENGVLTITITYDDDSDPTRLTVTIPRGQTADLPPAPKGAIDAVVINDTAMVKPGMAKTVDATMYFSGSGLSYSYEIIKRSAIKTIMQKPEGSGMFEISIMDVMGAEMYADGEVKITATNEAGLSASQLFKVRRNQKPRTGGGALIDNSSGDDDMLMLGTSSAGKANMKEVDIRTGSTEAFDNEDPPAILTGDNLASMGMHFLDDDDLTVSASSDDPRIATAEVVGKKLTITGLMSGMTGVSVRVEDSGNLIHVRRVSVTVDASPMVKKMLENVVVVGENTYVIKKIGDYFMDADDTLFISAVSGRTDVAAVAVADDGTLTVTREAQGTGTTKITVTAAEANEAGTDAADGAQTVMQSFTVEFK